jgi:hypothetical protein
MTDPTLDDVAPTLLTLEERIAQIANAHNELSQQIEDIKGLVASIIIKLKL